MASATQGTVADTAASGPSLLPYVPRLLTEWTAGAGDGRHMRVTGSLAFVDISGFTRLTERLARKGKVGAEEMSDTLSATFAGLLSVARADGADLVKWGGDAVLLLFQGAEHAGRAARSAYRMRQTLRSIGRLGATSGRVTLRMSVGIHSGDFDFFLVGDPAVHRELLISGPGASVTAEVEAAASAGEIGLSAATAALLPRRLLGRPLAGGRLLRSQPELDDLVILPRQGVGIDPASVLPTNIRAHLLAGVGEPEHRPITVAFVQFSGTDALLDVEGPAALADALDQCVRNVQSACADHEVTFFESDINRDGGKIMLTAGAPRSAGHDEERMLRVARLVMDRAGRLPLRIGINRGHVFAGDFGPDFRRTYSVKGDAINLAARVMAKAVPGQVLATTQVLERSQSVFRTDELPPFMVKGKSMPVRAAEVGDLVGARREGGIGLPFVGRASEMAVLRSALDDVRARRGRLVEIVGEPGIGKSRLVAELLADADGVVTVSAPSEEYESSTAYFPFRRLLRDVLGIAPDTGPEEAARRLADRVSANASRLLDWLPLLGVPMDVQLPPTRTTTELDDQFRKGRLEQVVTEFLSVVLPTPSVLVFDDAHLMDDASADLLRRIVGHLDQNPWMVLVTRRDLHAGFVPGDDEDIASVRPTPLEGDVARQLVEAALEDHPLPRQAMEALAARGGGNPMFLEALVREAGRSGSVAADLPESVEGLVTSQIDRLEAADRTVLRYAAVLGMEVDEGALLQLLDDHAERPPEGALDRLSGFLLRERAGRLRFRHSLLRDAAYEGLPFRRRRVLHDQVGETIERTAPSPEVQCELLSMHFFHAGRYDRAWRYSVMAGERALAKYANGDAIDFLRRAVASAGHAGSSIERTRLADVLDTLGDALLRVGVPDEAAAAYAQARRLIREDPVRAAALTAKLAGVERRLRRFTPALGRISRAMRDLNGMTDEPANVARSVLARAYARIRYDQGQVDQAMEWAERAARAAEDGLDKPTLAMAYEMLNALHAGSGRVEVMPYGRMALQAYTELGDLPSQAACLNNLAVQAFGAGDWEDAARKYRQASEIYRRIGDTPSEGSALYNQIELLVRQRRYDDARPLLPDVLRIARAVKDDELVALTLREQSRVSAADGDVARARGQLEEARQIFHELEEPSELAATDLALAEVLLDSGDPDAAGGILSNVGGAGDISRVPALAPAAARLIGQVHLDAGRVADARAALESAVALAEQAGDRYEQGLSMFALAVARRANGSGDAEDLARRAGKVLEPMGVRLPVSAS